MEQVPLVQAMRRFTKHMIMGAVISGVACSIPLLYCINLLFCILNMGGIVWALQMYLKAFPDDKLNTNESLLFGAVAGAGAGLIVGILGSILHMIFFMIFRGLMINVLINFRALGSVVPAMDLSTVGVIYIILKIPVWVIVYAGFGLLGSFLGMQLFFKTRIRQV